MRSSRQPHSSVRHFGAGALLAFAACCLGACASDKASSGDSPTPGGGGAAGAGTSAAGTAGMPIAGGSSAAGSAGSTSSGGQGDSTMGGAGGSGVAGGGTGGTGGTGGIGGISGISGISGAAGASNEPFALKSSAFKEGDEIPLMYKCATVNPKGQNVSPPLSWGPGPSGTKSYAVVLMHLPSPEHWVIWDIPADITSLPENIEHTAEPAVPAHSKQSLANLDGFMGIGYLGPCPQAPNSPQSYRFTLYALDVDTLPGLTATSGPGAAAAVVKAHLVPGSQGVSLTGTQIQTP